MMWCRFRNSILTGGGQVFWRRALLPGALATRVIRREWLGEVTAAIRDHSFFGWPSAAVARWVNYCRMPDRLEALGMIGWVRMFATAGEMGSQLWHAADLSGIQGGRMMIGSMPLIIW